MKNLFRVPFAMFLACLVFVSCSKDDISDVSMSENVTFNKSIDKDINKKVLLYINNSMELISNVKDLGSVISFINDRRISEEEFYLLPEALGFRNEKEFINYLEKQDKLVRELDIEHQFFEMSEDQQLDVFHENFEEYENTTNGDCQTDYNWCAAEAIAINVMEQAGCASLNVTVVLGLLCHSAAATHLAKMGNDCNNAYEDCIG